MRDVVYLILVVAFFRLCVAYIAACARIVADDQGPEGGES